MDYTILNYTSPSDLLTQQERLQRLLQLQSKLQLEHEAATTQSVPVQEMRPIERSVEEVRFDETYQRQQLMNNLQQILTAEEARKVIGQLSPEDMYYTNLYFPDIASKTGKDKSMYSANEALSWIRKYLAEIKRSNRAQVYTDDNRGMLPGSDGKDMYWPQNWAFTLEKRNELRNDMDVKFVRDMEGIMSKPNAQRVVEVLSWRDISRLEQDPNKMYNELFTEKGPTGLMPILRFETKDMYHGNMTPEQFRDYLPGFIDRMKGNQVILYQGQPVTEKVYNTMPPDKKKEFDSIKNIISKGFVQSVVTGVPLAPATATPEDDKFADEMSDVLDRTSAKAYYKASQQHAYLPTPEDVLKQKGKLVAAEVVTGAPALLPQQPPVPRAADELPYQQPMTGGALRDYIPFIGKKKNKDQVVATDTPTKARALPVAKIYDILVEEPFRKSLSPFVTQEGISQYLQQSIQAQAQNWMFPKDVVAKMSEVVIGLKGNTNLNAVQLRDFLNARFKTSGGKIKWSNRKRIMKVGKGLPRVEQQKWREFGKFIIHEPSLKKRSLNLRYTSMAPVPAIPKHNISKLFADVLLDMLDNGKINNTLVSMMPASEQGKLSFLCHKAEVGDVGLVGEGIGADEEFDRFELLKNEVIAGQNSPETLRELKSYILRFMGDGRIRRTEGMSLLADLAILS